MFSAQIEEAIAEGIGNMQPKSTPSGPIKNAIAKIRRLFKVLREWMQVHEITDADALIDAIEEGVIGARRIDKVAKANGGAMKAFQVVSNPSTGRRTIRAFHGSPYDFERFDVGKLGAGEGMAAYGKGLYFAEDEGVAKHYRAFLSNRKGTDGRVYEVDINADPDDFLDWSLPFSEWPADHISALKNTFEKYMDDVEDWFPDLVENGGTLSDVLDNFDDIPVEGLNGALMENGVAGVKFWDGTSRGFPGAAGTDSTRNYVVFDDAKIEVVRKYQRQAEARDEQVSEDIGETVTNSVTPETTAEERQETFIHAAMTQPIDTAFKALFMPLGGINAEGKWAAGAKGEQWATRMITEALPGENNPLSVLNPIIERARHGLIDRHGLPAEYVEIERQRGIDESELMHEGLEHLKGLKNLGPEESKVLHAILTGEDVTDADMATLAEPIRRAIDEMGQEAVNLGLISADAYERNRGKYLHRVYESHEAGMGTIRKTGAKRARGKRQKIAGDQFKGRGLFETVPAAKVFKGLESHLGTDYGAPQKGDSVIILEKRSTTGQEALEGVEPGRGRLERRVYWPAGKPIPEAFQGYENRGEFEVRGEKGKDVVLWRDFTKEERTAMGEIIDAKYAIAKTYHIMAQDLATGRFFKSLAENEDWVKSQPPAGAEVAPTPEKSIPGENRWVRVPNTKIGKSDTYQYGALAGKYIRADMWQDMAELQKMQNPTLYRDLLTIWKLNKTARNPVVHMNNIMSNFMLMDMADIRVWDLIEAAKQMKDGGPLYEEAKLHGAFGADMVAQELRRDVLAPMLKELKDDARGGKGLMRSKIGIAGVVPDKIWAWGTAADRKMVNLYQFEDEIFRMATYIRRKKQGVDAHEAAIEARDQFLNYDIRAPWVNMARGTVLPFISYTYRAVPRLAKTVAERPWKIAKYAALAYAFNAMAYMIAPSGDDEDEERGSMRSGEQGGTWTGTPRMIRMPYLSDYGDPVFLDIRRWIPAADVFESGTNEALPFWPDWLQLGGPMMIGAELWMNRAAFTGDDIVNTVTDTPTEMAVKQGGHLYRSWMPSAPWIPKGWYWNKIGRAFNEEARTYTGDPYSKSEAVLSSVGIKVKPKDVDFGYRQQEWELDQEERELKSDRAALKRQKQRGLDSQANYDRAVTNLNLKLAKVKAARQKIRDLRR